LLRARRWRSGGCAAAAGGRGKGGFDGSAFAAGFGGSARGGSGFDGAGTTAAGLGTSTAMGSVIRDSP